MEGILFIVDDLGERTAAAIHLAEYGEVWEDFYEGLIAQSRKNGEKIPWGISYESLTETARRGRPPTRTDGRAT